MTQPQLRRVATNPTKQDLGVSSHLYNNHVIHVIEEKTRIRVQTARVCYTDSKLEAKRQAAIDTLGTWWKAHEHSTFINRGEHWLTIYHRDVIRKRATRSWVTGAMMLGADLKNLIANIGDDERVYIGDLKLMGDSENANTVNND
jgi:hypothetical protein